MRDIRKERDNRVAQSDVEEFLQFLAEELPQLTANLDTSDDVLLNPSFLPRISKFAFICGSLDMNEAVHTLLMLANISLSKITPPAGIKLGTFCAKTSLRKGLEDVQYLLQFYDLDGVKLLLEQNHHEIAEDSSRANNLNARWFKWLIEMVRKGYLDKESGPKVSDVIAAYSCG
jgi:hypothetical protein